MGDFEWTDEVEGKVIFFEGDWAAYNWLDSQGNDNWKVGRIVDTKYGLMYFLDGNSSRSGYIPLSDGVKKLSNI